MKASETTLQSVIEGQKQYIVPLYQRPYRWKREHWQDLWDDLVDLCDPESMRTHFLGSIVTMLTTSVPEGVPKFFLIDGQQRLTTIFILLSLLRDRSRAGADEADRELGDEIHDTLLVNAYKKGNDHFRLLPTQDDRLAYQAIIRGEAADPSTQVALAYRFFEAKLHGKGPDVPALKRAITESLSVVSITLDRDDNPYSVFESLNAKGEPLAQADLIRNFFFLRIHADRQDEMHRTFWRPMEEALDKSLTDFIRHYLMRQGNFVREDSVYFTLKDRPEAKDALALLEDLARSAGYYARLLRPSLEPRPALRAALERLDRLKMGSVNPFLLNCYDELESGRLSAEDMVEIVKCLEIFLVRRSVCNIPTNQINKLFPPLYNQIKAGGFGGLLDGVRKLLPTRGFPKDFEFRKALIDGKLYGAGDRQLRAKFLLESIERSFAHKESVDIGPLTIEHVMPQTLTDPWREALGEEWEADHQLALHTLGNLTLTGLNSELSNASFAKKKQQFATSHVDMNRYFSDLDIWDAQAIEARGAVLADRALTIWPDFGDLTTGSETEPDLNARPVRLHFLGRTYPVKTWKAVLERTVDALAEADPEYLDKLAEEFPALIAGGPTRFRSSHPLPGGRFLNTHHSAKGVNRWCARLLESAEIASEDWKLEFSL